MRLPNGYGSITKLSGKRRKPYMVRVTAGLDEDTREPVRKVLGYYAKRSEAISALASYNQNPYDLSAHAYTFAEVYQLWSAKYFNGLSRSAVGNHVAAYNACKPLHDLIFKQIRLIHLQEAVNNSGKSNNTQIRMKNLISLMYTYAIRLEITDKDYSGFIEIKGSDKPQKPHVPFSTEEIETLWANLGSYPFLDTVLILIYTGLRAGELLNIKTENVHLDEKYMIGGSKTEAGKNRLIPLNEKILPLIQARYQAGSEYLIEPHITYPVYSHRFDKLMEQLNMEHRTHDGRHTFASLMDTAGANLKCIKTIMGHSGGDLTSKVYIHKALPELLEAVNLI